MALGMAGAAILRADPASVVRVSEGWSRTQADANSSNASISPDGTHVGFACASDVLSAADTNGTTDIYLYDHAAETCTLVSASAAGVVGNAISERCAVAQSARFVAFESAAVNLTDTDTNGAADIFVKDMATGLITRVSVASDGTQANGPSRRPAISADGNLVAFLSEATNLVDDDTNDVDDIFVHSRKTGKTWRVSVSDDGIEGNGNCTFPALSGDGAWVAFESLATNLVANDTNGSRDVFLRPVARSGMARVSVSTAGTQGNGDSFAPSLSPDGRYVAFDSDATNLVTGDTNGCFDVFVRDREGGTTTRASVDSDGNQANQDSYNAAVTDDGDVVFQSWATNLVDDDTNGAWDVFSSTWSGTYMVSVSPGNAPGTANSQQPSVSADGNAVAFHSWAPNLVAGDANGACDVFMRNFAIGSSGMQLASASSSALLDSDGTSTVPAVSGDGSRIVFASAATNLVPGDTNAVSDIFVFNRTTGTMTRTSVSRTLAEATAASARPRISADGFYVVFDSTADNLVTGDTNGLRDVFLKQLNNHGVYRALGVGGVEADAACYSPVVSNNREVAFYSAATNLVGGDTNGVNDIFVANIVTPGNIERVSVSTAGIQGNGASTYPAITPDGRYVAFVSAAANLLVGDVNGVYDAFVRDRQEDTTECVSISTAGTQGDGQCTFPAISDDGRYVAFQSSATNLVDDDTNGVSDIFVYDRQEDIQIRASLGYLGNQANASCTNPRISGDGRYVTFQSGATNLVAGDTNGRIDVFVRDLLGQRTVRASMTEFINGQAPAACESPDISADGRHVVFASAAALVMQDANGVDDVFLALNPQPALSPGMIFRVDEAESPDFTDPTFTSKPKVAVAYTDPVKFTDKRKTAKVLTKFGADVVPVGGGVNCEWKAKVALFDRKIWPWGNRWCRDSTRSFGDQATVGELRLDATLADGSRLRNAAAGERYLVAPEITWIIDPTVGDKVVAVEPGQQLRVAGAFLGGKPPKVWLEYKDAKGKIKQAKCRVQGNRYFDDAAGNPNRSCMDPASGYSVIEILLPARWPKGWMPGRHDLVIDNGCGRACFRILTE
jgi:Tol biopolymer transport system component